MKLVRTVVAALLALLAAPALAQDAPPRPAIVMAAGDLRPAEDLSGAWRYSVDPYRNGLAGFHGGRPGRSERRDFDGDVAAFALANPLAWFEFDMDRSAVATLPGAWIGHDPTLRHYVGLTWYQRLFTTRPQPGTRQFLRFGAVDYRAHVFLNGEAIGGHEGGSTPFVIEVTGKLRDGENRLTVGADAGRTPQSVPPPVTDWETYGGITRPVTLVTVPATFVDDAWVRLTEDGRVAVDVALNGAGAANAAVRVRIDGLGTLDGRTDATGRWQGSIRAPRSLRRWSPESPTLYDVSVEAGEDRWRDRVGFRTIAVRGEDILLNGRSIFLRGISMHEEELGANPVRAMTPAAARALLSEIRDGLNGNFVRLAHYPHAETVTRAADEMGLLVWSEVPVYWRVAFDDPATLGVARAMQADNILRDRNRASIVIWSIANETPVGDARNAFLRRLAADARALDGTRLISAALLTERRDEGGVPTYRIDDPLVPDLDVMSVNTYAGWYSEDPLASLPAMRWVSDHGKPLIFSEFGADALAGFRDPEIGRKFSEDFQADYYRQTLAMTEQVPFLRGLSPWLLKDFRSPRRQHPVYQQGWNRKGLISETGRRKLAFEVLADHYRDLIANGSQSQR